MKFKHYHVFCMVFFKICSFFHTLNYIKDSIMPIGENIDLRLSLIHISGH